MCTNRLNYSVIQSKRIIIIKLIHPSTGYKTYYFISNSQSYRSVVFTIAPILAILVHTTLITLIKTLCNKRFWLLIIKMCFKLYPSWLVFLILEPLLFHCFSSGCTEMKHWADQTDLSPIHLNSLNRFLTAVNSHIHSPILINGYISTLLSSHTFTYLSSVISAVSLEWIYTEKPDVW